MNSLMFLSSKKVDADPWLSPAESKEVLKNNESPKMLGDKLGSLPSIGKDDGLPSQSKKSVGDHENAWSASCELAWPSEDCADEDGQKSSPT